MDEVNSFDTNGKGMKQFEKHRFWWEPMNFDVQGLAVTALATLGVLILGTYILRRHKQKKIESRLPPGPRPWPVLGNLPSLGPMAHQDLAVLAKTYGPIMTMKFGSVPVVVVSSPKYAEEILKTHDHVFASRPPITQANIFLYGREDIVFADYGVNWRHARKVFVVELFTAKRVQQFQHVRKEEILSTLRSILEESKDGKGVRMELKFGDLAKNNVTRMMISQSLFGSDSTATTIMGNTEHVETFRELLAYFARPILGDYIPFLKGIDIQGYIKPMLAIRAKMDNIMNQILKEHRERLDALPKPLRDEDLQDIVDVLLTRPDATGEKPLSDNQIKGIIQDILLGGTDTASNTMEWTLAEIVKNPDIHQRLLDELDEVVGRDRLVEESDVPKLHYLHAVVKESLRLHPVVPLMIPHQSTQDREVGDYLIPNKCRILINVWWLARDDQVWDKPLEFNPDRFTNSTVDNAGQNFEYLPFGSGRRSCPGRMLGLLLVHYTIAILLQTCNFTRPDGLKREDLDLEEGFGITMSLKYPLQVVATLRLPSSLVFQDDSTKA